MSIPERHVYVAVRRDIPLAHQAVQAVHAGISAARELIPDSIAHLNLVLCTVPDQSALLGLLARCNAAGVQTRVFVESDMDNQPTALASEPVDGARRRLFRDLPLFNGET